MATAQLGTVVRYIRGLAACEKNSEQTDETLLRAFLRTKDEASFEALVRRHGPMVLRVCRRTLGNAHDAEDALQAVFVVLAQHAPSIRKKESLASWLHGVAYRMATHAKRAAARRHRHETRVSPTPPPDPALSAAWQEIQVLLDQEIARLSETLRAPFVCCCLENKSCAEAAHQLGIEEATVRKRLSRARQHLQERLTRRGVSLTAVLAAAAVGTNGASAAVSRSLVCSMVSAAGQVAAGQTLRRGLVPTKVASLVEGVNQTMFIGKCKTIMLLLVGTTILGAGLGVGVLRRVQAEPPLPGLKALPQGVHQETIADPHQPAGAAAQREAKDIVTIRGQVVDPAGKPFTGAKVYVGGHTRFKAPDYKAPAYPLRATSTADGNFAFTFTKSELDKADPEDARYQILAVAEGYGCAWVTADTGAEELTLRLVKDAPVSGRILDTDGKPVAGAKLTVMGVCAAKDNEGNGFVDRIRNGMSNAFSYLFAKGWVGPLPRQATVLTTGADGKFRLAGVGSDRVVGLLLEGRGIATAALGAHGSLFEYQASVSRPIRGVVRDKATGKPLAGVTLVWLDTYNRRYEVTPWRQRMAITDKNGRYELLGAPKFTQTGYSHGTLQVRPAEGQLYFQHTVVLGDSPGLDPLTVDIELWRGLTVRGEVTDMATGQPIAGALVEYYPLYANPNAVKLPASSSLRSEATTGPDGSYALTVLPGQGVIGVVGPRPNAYMSAYLKPEEIKAFFKTPLGGKGDHMDWAIGGNQIAPLAHDDGHVPCNALVLIEPGEKEETLVKDVALERPQELKGRVVGLDGEPLQGVTVYGLGSGGGSQANDVLTGAEFTVRGLNPREPRELVFYHKGKSLGLFLKELPAEKAGPLTVTLQPCGSATGRIVDGDGQPVADVPIHFEGIRRRTLNAGGRQQVTTDKDGRFHVEGLVPGVTYGVYAGPPAGAKKGLGFLTNVSGVEPGKRKDLGDVQAQAN